MADNQTWAILPAKPFDEAKSRLEGVLSAAERYDLARALLLQSLAVLQAGEDIDQVLVVSADPVVLTLAAEHGALTLQETQGGLNRALVQARRHAMLQGAESLLVVAADLPLLTTSEIRSMFGMAGTGIGIIIAADRRRQGTNALLLRPPDAIEFAFGEESFRRHLALAHSAGLDAVEFSIRGLSFDLDLPEDWRDLLALGWLPRPVSPSNVRGTPGSHVRAPRVRRPSA